MIRLSLRLLEQLQFELKGMKKQKSPCVDLCDFSNPKGWCLGCARTRDECQKWKTLKPYALNILKKELQKRMLQMRSERSK